MTEGWESVRRAQRTRDLRGLESVRRCTRSQRDVPLMILLNGNCASIYTISAAEQKTRHTILYRTGMFPACPPEETAGFDDTDNGFLSITYYATFACYRIRARDLVHANSMVTRIPSRIVIIPPSIPLRDAFALLELFHKAIDRATSTSMRLTSVSYYNELSLLPNELRGNRFNPY